MAVDYWLWWAHWLWVAGAALGALTSIVCVLVLALALTFLAVFLAMAMAPFGSPSSDELPSFLLLGITAIAVGGLAAMATAFSIERAVETAPAAERAAWAARPPPSAAATSPAPAPAAPRVTPLRGAGGERSQPLD
jgi:hypothetical protein